MESLDLGRTAPRSPYATLDGLIMLPRTIDKLRAELPGGVPGEYHYAGFSQTIVEALGLDIAGLRACVREVKTDDDVAAWVRANATNHDYETINEMLLARKLDDSNRERLTQKYPVILRHPEVSRLFDVIVLDDEQMFAQAK